ncbi:FeoB-associated Cys-rich membrane protein [Sinomicrobium weinanense]|uniref:FeoB-associated Cys-rich membrane protein n=1 Tax=Sinomicrobium weinanense TaxID=2842200 RepID=A0A926Q0L8_9FLAO|nr:FeoB-associated Cys-rich membrane protein [Sinomicrobium weinanense]MBC9794918.1 FeoB-associated Cys-rich membrane protein [Sinomicrobium weinanense]MBU3125689.1 FeoB-associated Cys-rich membrane protein [Sinomicrobium weinanense]
MPDIQTILVYAALAIAVGFLVKKFFLPKKKTKKACSNQDCGCH